VQGGAYANARVEALISHLRDQGVRGVGMSSWGPAVFACAENLDEALWILKKAQNEPQRHAGQLLVVSPDNSGARVSRG
jgi:beta-ribofuranosylaminobenzene 5'-phosphate synthase